MGSTRPDEAPVVILCGGRGTRLRERTESVPKALVEIGGRPILWHVIQIYAAQGFERFLLATGYLGEAVAGVRGGASAGRRGSRSSASTPASTRRPAAASPALGERLGGERFCVTYADGVADVDLGALLEFHRAHGGLATMTVVRPHLQWGVAELGGRPGRRLRREAAQRALDQRRLPLLRAGRARLPRRGQRARARAAAAARRRRRAARLPPRGLLGLHGHLQGRGRRSTTSGPAARRPGGSGTRPGRRRGEAGAGHRRPRLRRLAPGAGAARARRRGHRARPGAAAALRAAACRGSRREVELVEADLRDAARVGATVAAGEFDVVFHLAAQTLVGPAMADPAATFEANVRGTWTLLEACRRADVPAVVVASSDKAYGPSEELPYREDDAAAPRLAVRGEQGGGRRDRAQLPARLRPAGRGHPLRQHLRRRRPQLLPPDPGGDRRRARRPPPRRSAPTAAPSATSSTSTTRSPPTWRSSTRSGPAARRRARPSTPAASVRTRSPRCWRRSPRSPAPGSSPNTTAPATRPARSTASSSTRRSCAS